MFRFSLLSLPMSCVAMCWSSFWAVDSAELSQTGEDISSRRLIRAERRIDSVGSAVRGECVCVECECVSLCTSQLIIITKGLGLVITFFFCFGLKWWNTLLADKQNTSSWLHTNSLLWLHHWCLYVCSLKLKGFGPTAGQINTRDGLALSLWNSKHTNSYKYMQLGHWPSALKRSAGEPGDKARPAALSAFYYHSKPMETIM